MGAKIDPRGTPFVTFLQLEYVVANLRVWRREAYLSHLRPTFSQVERCILRRSPIFTFLFDEDRLQEAI